MPRPKRPPPSRSRPPRIRWTETEKAKLIEKAVDIQRDNPGLSGLPLLRAAMHVLHSSRRRVLNAITQAPFFEPGVVAEIKRRTAQERADAETKATRIVGHPEDPYRDLLERNTEANEAHRIQTAEWRADRQRFEDAASKTGQSILAVLSLVHRELQTLNAKLGQPDPMIDPRETPQPPDHYRRNGKR